ncbi:MAG: 4Fe-4S binding protein [Thermodesulfobacteriota bacterium]|nr:4Fe-4S binding protein [Thermodesulfobacteriota bacterium]
MKKGAPLKMKWSEEAKEAVLRVPFFVRKRVIDQVEEEALKKGADSVTLGHVRSCQKRFLNRMEDEVKGYQVETCFGPGGCCHRAFTCDSLVHDLEQQMSRQDLKAFFKERVDGPLKMHHEFRISISDCPNACSRPQIADIGLIGACEPIVTDKDCSECGACVEACKEKALSIQHGRPVVDEGLCLYCGACVRLCPSGTIAEGRAGYRIQIGGKLGRHPRLAIDLPGIYKPDDLTEVIDKCLQHYKRHCLNGERFGEVLKRTGSDIGL